MLTLAQAADMTGALVAYKVALAEERVAELKGRLDEIRQERDGARSVYLGAARKVAGVVTPQAGHRDFLRDQPAYTKFNRCLGLSPRHWPVD